MSTTQDRFRQTRQAAAGNRGRASIPREPREELAMRRDRRDGFENGERCNRNGELGKPSPTVVQRRQWCLISRLISSPPA